MLCSVDSAWRAQVIVTHFLGPLSNQPFHPAVHRTEDSALLSLKLALLSIDSEDNVFQYAGIVFLQSACEDEWLRNSFVTPSLDQLVSLLASNVMLTPKDMNRFREEIDDCLLLFFLSTSTAFFDLSSLDDVIPDTDSAHALPTSEPSHFRTRWLSSTR